MENIKRIKKINVSDEVFNQMRTNIISKRWKTGMQLPSETSLGVEFGVSRSTIRSALQKLSAIGMVEIRNGEGTFIKEVQIAAIMSDLIRDISVISTDIIEMLEVRQGIEMISCRLAAIRRTEEELKEMKNILHKMSEHQKESNPDKYSVEDMNFHILIAKMSKNPILESMMNMLKDLILNHITKVNLHIGVELGFEKHKELYEHIKNQREIDAEKLIYNKLRETITAVKTLENLT